MLIGLNCRILGCLLLGGSIAWGQAPDAGAIGVSGAYRVGPGDVLAISVFEVEELSKTAVVTPRGTISLPLIGEVPVQSGTTTEIEDLLTQLYGRDLLRDPQISVKVEAFRSQPVSILGAVDRPGVYQLRGRRRLVEVLAMAGGLAPDVGDEITITRRGPTAALSPAPALDTGAALLDTNVLEPAGTAMLQPAADEMEIHVSVRELLTNTHNDESNPLIEPHDAIQVDKAGVVYVIGSVVKTGGYPVKDQEVMTVLRAVSLAEGLARYAAPQKARIIRELAGVKQEIPVRIKDVLKGKAPDLELVDNDILFVPGSGTKAALSRGTEAAIQMATGVVIWRR